MARKPDRCDVQVTGRRSGGQIVLQQLHIHDARRVFLVSGESLLPCLDAWHEYVGHIQPILRRQEGGALVRNTIRSRRTHDFELTELSQ